MKRRYRPKDWPCKRHPERSTGVTLGSMRDVLGDLYSLNAERPWWAKLAYSRGWMSSKAYYDVPKEWVSRRIRMLYSENPYVRLLAKHGLFP